VARGYGRISGGTRVWELAAESHEAPLRYGARSTSTCLMTLSRTKGGSTTLGARRIIATGGATRYGGGLIRMIRRRTTRYGGFE
jgi:hypothetical protein